MQNNRDGQLKRRGLILSAYDAGSHRYWREGIARYLNEFDWVVITLPARYFSWRIRGNPLSFLEEHSNALEEEYDFIIATSMVDLATLKGIAPKLATVPTLLYFHENQFEYPKSNQQNTALEPQMVNLYSALAADLIIFNSNFNRSSFFTGCSRLMKKLPDYTLSSIEQRLGKKSSVIPVPIADDYFDLHRLNEEFQTPVRIVWNHRWEYDKGPDRLLLFLKALESRKVSFEISIVGERFRAVPPQFEEIESQFRSQLKVFGYIKGREEYSKLLGDCDIVLSTSIHEFQGVSVMEAVAAGCIPLVPARLSYTEFVNPVCCYPSYLDCPKKEAEAAVDTLLKIMGQTQELCSVRDSYKEYCWSNLIAEYRVKIEQLLAN